MENENHLEVGTAVEKHTGDYKFIGLIVSRFVKRSGKVRYVVENSDGVLHIFSRNQLRTLR